MAKQISVTVKVVPVSGKARTHRVQVAKNLGGRDGKAVGPTVGTALEIAEVDARSMDITIGGKRANRRTSIKPGDEIVVAERPAGS